MFRVITLARHVGVEDRGSRNVGVGFGIPVKTQGIVDQQASLQLRRGRELRNQVDQVAIVRHVGLEVGMRPIRAPEHAIGEQLDEASRERHEVTVVRRATDRQPLGAAHLRPNMRMPAHQAHEAGEFRPVERLRDIGPPHVIHHHRRRQLREERLQLGQILRLEIHHHVPAQRLDASRDFEQDIGRSDVHQAFHEIEAHAPHTRVVQLLQLSIGHFASHGGDTARATPEARSASISARLSAPWQVP